MYDYNRWVKSTGVAHKYIFYFPNGAEVEIIEPKAIYREENGTRIFLCSDGSLSTINSDWVYARTFPAEPDGFELKPSDNTTKETE